MIKGPLITVINCDEEEHTTPHSRLSCSGSKAWIKCTAKIPFEESLPEVPRKPNRFTAQGTAAHKLFEISVDKGLPPVSWAGSTIIAEGFKFTVDEDMIEAVNVAYDFVIGYCDECDINGFDIPEVQTEVYCHLSDLGIKGMEGGTTDNRIFMWDQQFVMIVDYKHGSGVPVEAIGNTQMRMYALATFIEMYKKKHPDANFKKTQTLEYIKDEFCGWKVDNVIIQPRAPHNDGPIRSELLSVEELIDWAIDELIPAAKAIISGDTKFEPSEDGCRWCKGFGNCAATSSVLAEAAMLDFDALPDVTKPKLPDVTKLTPEQKTFILLNESLIVKFMEAVRAQVQHEVEHGSKDYSNHLKIVRKNTNRRLEEDFDDELSPIWDHLEEDDIYEKKPKGIGKIEDTLARKLKEKMGLRTLKAAKEEAAKVLEPIVFKPLGDTILVPNSDRRKEIKVSAADDFEDC